MRDAQARPCGRGDSGQVRAIQPDDASGGFHQAGDRPQGGGLACAVRAEQGDHLPAATVSVSPRTTARVIAALSRSSSRVALPLAAPRGCGRLLPPKPAAPRGGCGGSRPPKPAALMGARYQARRTFTILQHMLPSKLLTHTGPRSLAWCIPPRSCGGDMRRPARRGTTMLAALAVAALAAGCSSATSSSTSAPVSSGPVSSTPVSSAPGTGGAGSASVTNYLTYVDGKAGPANASLPPVYIGFINQQGGQSAVGPLATAGAQMAVKYMNAELGGSTATRSRSRPASSPTPRRKAPPAGSRWRPTSRSTWSSWAAWRSGSSRSTPRSGPPSR